jgi:hypothetical protein
MTRTVRPAPECLSTPRHRALKLVVSRSFDLELSHVPSADLRCLPEREVTRATGSVSDNFLTFGEAADIGAVVHVRTSTSKGIRTYPVVLT